MTTRLDDMRTTATRLALVLCSAALAASCGDIDAEGGKAKPPEPASIAPASGPTAGGQLVAITGAGFDEGMAVLFDGAPATDVRVTSGGVVTALTPPHAEGAVTVTLHNGEGASADLPTPYQYVRSYDQKGDPRVVGAVSTGNTGVRVVFSEPVSDGSDDPGNFSIGQANVNAESAYLPVDSASLTEDGIAVELVTGSQNEVLYELTASNIRDLDGNLLAPPELLVNPSVVTFAGTPPSAEDGTLVDTDGDGLSDNTETSGWMVTVFLSNGDFVQSTHTSDPTKADTDSDGLDDRAEMLAGTNPRSADTDGDTIGDADEKRVWRSNPTHQDTDEDRMPDSTELEFDTSPILDDTDGDGFGDYEELFELSRDPLVADVPRPQVTVTQYDLQLDTQFQWTDETGEVRTHSESTSSSVSQARASSLSRSDTRSVQNSDSHSASAGFEIEASSKGVSGKVSGSYTFERSTARGYTSSVDRTTATESQASQEESVARALQESERRAVTKSITGATVTATVNVGNDSDVPFTLANLEISALRQDRSSGGDFRPVATLVPASGEDLELNLGPFDAERGPIIFQSSDIFPSLVEELMREPNGLVFKVANFDVLDEEGRVFAFSSAEVASRTAGITIDFGDGRVVSKRVATHNSFTPDGRPRGISIERAVELLGYELREPGEPLPEPFPDPLPEDTRLSIGTAVDEDGVERLIRVGGVQNDFAASDPEKRFWGVQTNDETISPDADFSGIELRAGDELMLFYTADVDEDGLFEREELVYGSSDRDTDTDGDGLSDFEEVRQGWMVAAMPGLPYRAFPSPARFNSDLDGLDDLEERARGTDPNRGDTDRDGLKDDYEIDGDQIRLFDGDADETNDPILDIVPYSDVVELLDGGDGMVSTEVAEGTDDVQVVPLGDPVAPGEVVIGPGPNGFVETAPAGDETVVIEEAIDAGLALLEATCETAADASSDDVQVIAVGEPMGNQSACVWAGPDGLLDSTAEAGDEMIIVTQLVASADGTVSTAAKGDDVQIAAVGDSVTTGAVVIDSGRNGVLETTAGTDTERRSTRAVGGGPRTGEPICETTAAGGDVQVTPHGVAPAAPGVPCVRAGPDGVLDTDDIGGNDYVRAVHDGYFAIDPRRRDTDADGIPDGRELAIGTNPNRIDQDLITDTDQDGLFDAEEAGWQVEWIDGADMVVSEREGSNVNAPDTDLDGLPDVFEFALGTNPRRRDTDRDGLSDLQEYDPSNTDGHYTAAQLELARRRCAAAPACEEPTVGTPSRCNPLRVDTDADGRADADEVAVPWVVTRKGPTAPDPYEVWSKCYSADEDSDGWNDSQELGALTDPDAADTDEDGTADGVEPTVTYGTLQRDPLRPDKLVILRVPETTHVVGNCSPGGGSSDSEWRGDLMWSYPGAPVTDRSWWFGACNGATSGDYCGLARTVVFMLEETESFQISYSDPPIVEDDGTADDVLSLTGSSPQVPGAQSFASATSKSFTFIFNDTDFTNPNNCRVDQTVSWDVR